MTIAHREGSGGGDLPATVPDLVLAYLNELNRNIAADSRRLATARCTTTRSGSPGSACGRRAGPLRSARRGAGGPGGDDAHQRLEYLEGRGSGWSIWPRRPAIGSASRSTRWPSTWPHWQVAALPHDAAAWRELLDPLAEAGKKSRASRSGCRRPCWSVPAGAACPTRSSACWRSGPTRRLHRGR